MKVPPQVFEVRLASSVKSWHEWEEARERAAWLCDFTLASFATSALENNSAIRAGMHHVDTRAANHERSLEIALVCAAIPIHNAAVSSADS